MTFDMVYPGAGQPTVGPMSPSNNQREFNVYATYPRKQLTTNGPNGCVLNGNANANGTNGSEPEPLNGSIRGILRHKSNYSPIHALYDAAHNETLDTTFSTSEPIDGPTRRLNCDFATNARCLLAEFIAVLFVSFVMTFTEASLLDMKTQRIVRISLCAIMEATVLGIFVNSFKEFRVCISPAISLGQMFAGDTSPVLCALQWMVQFVAACAGVFCYQMVTLSDPSSAMHVQLPSLENGIAHQSSWFYRMYQLVLSQSITSALTVLASLATTSPAAVSGAVAVSSLLSLFVSSASWNPMRSLSSSVVSTANGVHVSSWSYHYVFWLGPLIGSLFASFVWRLIFAPEEKRLQCCCRCGRKKHHRGEPRLLPA